MKGRHFFLVALSCALFSFASLAGWADVNTVSSADIASRGLQGIDFPRSQELVPGVYAYEGLHSPLPDGVVFNTVSLIVVTTDGVMVVDGQGDVRQTKLMIDYIKSITPQPIKYVVVASDHGDHTGGNAAFKAAYPDVQFISSPASQLRLANTPTPPDQTVAAQRNIKMGATDIQILNLGRAHTGGDLAVYLPESKVLFLGEIYLRGLFPAMRTAYPSEWLAAIEKAQAMDVSWYIPGHGFIDDAATMERDLEAFRQAIAAVVKESQRLHSAGETCESAHACSAADKANWGQYQNWTASNNQAPFAIHRIYGEIEGKLDGTQTAVGGRGLVELWKSGRPAFGQYVTRPRAQNDASPQKPAAFAVEVGRELAENPLLDYTFLSLEDYYDIESARNVRQGLHSRGADSAMAFLVRIPSISDEGAAAARERVKELLELGVDGVVIPHVRNIEEARLAVSFFDGANVWSADNPDGDVVAMLMLEDPDVFADLEEIANIPGYSVLACGIGSLTQALDGDRETAEALNMQALAHAQRAGLADMITANTESVAVRIDQGFLGLLVYGPKADEVLRMGRALSGR